MSVNKIDVNAVNAKTEEERVTSGGGNNSWSVDDEHIRKTSAYIRHSWRGKYLYRKMMLFMGIESFLWTLTDIVRAKRMKVAETITKHRHNDRT